MDTLKPYAEGEWMKLEVKHRSLSLSNRSATSFLSSDEETPVDRILRGPIWNYKEGRACGFEDLLFGKKTPKTLLSQEELFLKGKEWSPLKHITSSFSYYFLKKLRKLDPGSTALFEIETGRQLKYGDLVLKGQSVASGLRWLGISPGQVIAVVSYNSLEVAIIILASLLVGSVLALIDPSLNSVDIGRSLRIACPRLIFSECGKTLSKVEIAIGYMMTPRVPKIIVNDNYMSNKNEMNGHMTFSKIMIEVEPNFKPAFKHANPNNPVFILYTSGTTGSGKGALISEKFFMNSHYFAESEFTTIRTITTLIAAPIIWLSMIGSFFIHLNGGHRIVFFRGPTSEPILLTALRKYEVAFWLTGPSPLLYLMNWPVKPRCPALKVVMVTGMPLAEEYIIRIRDQLFDGTVHICQFYGLTECGMLTGNSPFSNKIGSVGKVFYNVWLKVVEPDTGIALGPCKEGELCFKSNSMMLGYYNNPEASKNAYDEEGFFHTGDFGFYDEQGFVYVTGRLKDLIKWKSYQIVPIDVEVALLSNYCVEEAAVFGMHHDKEGQLVAAAITLKPGYKDVDTGRLKKLVNAQLSDIKKIRGGLYVLKQFPKTYSGKIIKGIVINAVIDKDSNEYLESTH